jgi:hypothetical protein
MHMIPTRKPAGRLVELPDGPQLLAATLCDGSTSPDTIPQRAQTWMKALGRPVRDVAAALEAIAWAAGLPLLKTILPAGDWLALGEGLAGVPADVDQQTLKEQPLVHQLLAGELAWTLATRLSETRLCDRLEKSGRAAISLGLGTILDRQGMLPAEHLRLLRPLLACWTRCRALAARLTSGGLGPRPEQHFQRFLRNALRCNRPDGRALFAEDDFGTEERKSQAGKPDLQEWGRELFEAALAGGAGEIDCGLAAVALPKLSPSVLAKPPQKTAALPPASIYFENGAVAVMRRNWNRDDERIAVLFAGQTCELELVSCGRVAACGAWRFEITQQGQQLQPVSNWEASCWYSDEDVDYLELEIKLTTGVTLQRQIVLAREDRFLYLADALMSPQRGNLEYRSVLPLAPHVEFRGAKESREGFLLFGRGGEAEGKSSPRAKPLAQVMPLAMPEWRAGPHPGELTATAEGLELRQSTVAQRLLAPLFIDLDRGRFRRRMTWRQLTVAESLAIVPAERAVGYRVGIGDRQWIIYRSLAAAANRTLLGHNLATESLIARFGKDGEIASIVEIE